MSTKTLLTALGSCLAAGIVAITVLASAAAAAPGAYKVLIVYVESEPPLQLQQQISAEPGVASVDLLSGGTETPTEGKLAGYDLVVDVPNNAYLDPIAYGDALAAYLDAGGVLVQFAYDNWESNPGVHNGPAGRFAAAGYSPLLDGDNVNELVDLGSFDSSSPLMQGVAPLTSGDNTASPLAPGATLVAQWSDGRVAVASKGQVVSVTAYTGGEEINGTGAYGRLAVNAVRVRGRQPLTVANGNPNGGTVTSSVPGIGCGAACSAIFKYGTQLSLNAAPNKGFVFGGFGGSCTGTTCALTMDSSKSVSAKFFEFGGGQKVRLKKKSGTAVLSFRVGGPGKLTLGGKKVKKRTKAVAGSGRVSIPIAARGNALQALRRNGQARVKFSVTFAPTGGTPGSFSRAVTLRLAAG